jgi:predicted transcriptional regulator
MNAAVLQSPREAWLAQRRAGARGIPPEMANRVAEMYARGMTQSEIGQELGVTQKAVWGFMKRHGIGARVAVKRNQIGERNSTWKGSAVTYKAAHNRVYAARGRPQYCEHCQTTEANRRYEWANLTGKHHDPADYARLCRSCHCKFDGLIRNLGAYAGRSQA